MIARFFFLLLVLLASPAAAQTYAIPNGNGGYIYLPANTGVTFSIGQNSFPPNFLQQATPAQLSALGILQVVQTPQPSSITNACAGSGTQIVAGVPTQVWNCTPLSATQIAANAAQATYASAISSGITITSTGTTALNGLYDVSPPSQAAVAAVAASIAAGQGVPGGASTFVYIDKNQQPHQFTAAQFLSFAVAVRDYVYALDLAATGAGSWPAASATIP